MILLIKSERMKQLNSNKKTLQLKDYIDFKRYYMPGDPKWWASIYCGLIPTELKGSLNSLSYHYTGNNVSIYSLILDVSPFDRIKLRTEIIFNWLENRPKARSWNFAPSRFITFTDDNCLLNSLINYQSAKSIVTQQYNAAKVFMSYMILPNLGARDFLRDYKSKMKSPEYRFWSRFITLLFKSKKLLYENIEFECFKDLSDEREFRCYISNQHSWKISTYYQKRTKKFTWDFNDICVGDEFWDTSDLIKIIKFFEDEVDKQSE